MNTNDYAPIALFIYNRPKHTQQTLEALQRCNGFKESLLYIFCDGPKKEGDDSAIKEARDIVRSMVSDETVFIESTINLGLANSIITGVSRLCQEYGKVIVLEDDLLVAPSFLKYMNDALELYKDEDVVMQVSGHMFSVPELVGKQKTFFLPFTTSWGWGTWERAWSSFDLDAKSWEKLKTDQKLRSKFNLDNSYNYYSMLEKQMAGKIDSWAIRWYWSVFKQQGLVLYPPSTLVNNIGFDGSGTHGWRSAKITNEIKDPKQSNEQQYEYPEVLEVNETAFRYVKKTLRNAGTGLFFKALKILTRMLLLRK